MLVKLWSVALTGGAVGPEARQVTRRETGTKGAFRDEGREIHTSFENEDRLNQVAVRVRWAWVQVAAGL